MDSTACERTRQIKCLVLSCLVSEVITFFSIPETRKNQPLKQQSLTHPASHNPRSNRRQPNPPRPQAGQSIFRPTGHTLHPKSSQRDTNHTSPNRAQSKNPHINNSQSSCKQSPQHQTIPSNNDKHPRHRLPKRNHCVQHQHSDHRKKHQPISRIKKARPGNLWVTGGFQSWD
jgi:hypothetical protein